MFKDGPGSGMVYETGGMHDDRARRKATIRFSFLFCSVLSFWSLFVLRFLQ